MKKIMIITLMFIYMTMVVSAQVNSNIEDYLINRQKIVFGEESEKIKALKDEESLKDNVLKIDSDVIFNEIKDLNKIEIFMLRPVLDLLVEKAVAEENTELATNINEIILSVESIEADAQIDKIYFATENNEEIVYAPEPEKAENITYPIVKDNVKVLAEIKSDLDYLPFTLEFKYTDEVIVKHYNLIKYDSIDEDTNLYKFDHKISDIYSNWPGMNNNPQEDGILECTVINGIDTRDSADEIFGFFGDTLVNRYGFVLRDMSISFGRVEGEQILPDANSRNLCSGGTITLTLRFGGTAYNYVAVRNTADWILFAIHGDHETGVITTETDFKWSSFAFQYAQQLLPPPSAPIKSLEGDTDTIIFESCSILDINDYNHIYPGEKEASPGKLWASLDDIRILGFNSLAYASDTEDIKKIFFKDSGMFASPESYWMACGVINRAVCAITKKDDYLYWHQKQLFDLPIQEYELKMVSKEEWQAYVPERDNKDVNINKVNKAIENIYGEKRISSNDVLKNISVINDYFTKNSNIQEVSAVRDDSYLNEILKYNKDISIKALLSQRELYGNDPQKYMEERFEIAEKGLLNIWNNNVYPYDVHSAVLLSMCYESFSLEKSRDILKKLSNRYPDFKFFENILEITRNINCGDFNKATENINKYSDNIESNILEYLESTVNKRKSEENEMIKKTYSLIRGLGGVK